MPTAADRIQKWVVQRLLAMPPSLLRRILRRPVVVRGRTLDPHLQLMLAAARGAPRIEEQTVERARGMFEAFSVMYEKAPVTVAQTQDLVATMTTGDIPVRIYRAHDWQPGGITLLYFHGGGHVIGSLASHDAACRRFANLLDAQVIAVDYRLAPEHRFPAAAQDAYAAWQWLLENQQTWQVDLARTVVGGDSAGGNLATVLCLQARDAGAPLPACQMLLYPMTDLRMAHDSYRDYADGYVLTSALMAWFIGHYSEPGDRENPLASPLLADVLSGLPPAVISLAGFDPLHDEGRAYARRLAEAGVPVDLLEHDDLVHGYVAMPASVASANKAVHDIALAVAARLGKTNGESS